MRDKNRIKPFLDKFAEFWEANPDLRFGQIIYMLAEHLKYPNRDVFFPEEEEWTTALEKVRTPWWNGFNTKPHGSNVPKQKTVPPMPKVKPPKANSIEIKELHIYMTYDYPEETLCDLHTTLYSLIKKGMYIHTTQTSVCSTERFREGYKIFVHMLDGDCVEIKLGSENKNSSREIKMYHNLEKLLLANEFGYATDCPNHIVDMQ